MTPTVLPQPVRLIARWPGKGDLTIVVDGAFVWLAADDVESLAGLPAWSDGETVFADDWPETRDGVAFYSAVAASRKAIAQGGALGAEFAAWLEETLPALTEPDVVEGARREVPLSDAVTIERAARELSDERGSKVRRGDLFDLLIREGWLERTGDGWAVLTPARAHGWATIRRVPHPNPKLGKHAAYHQPYITPAGMEELRRLLAAADARQADSRPDAVASEVLFDEVSS